MAAPTIPRDIRDLFPHEFYDQRTFLSIERLHSATFYERHAAKRHERTRSLCHSD